MRRLGRTRPFRRVHGEVVPGSVAEVAFRPLGGLDQWVMIRGLNATNPPLLLLHGGPGFGETALFRHFNSPLEECFTVVYWDQRGSGKSYAGTVPASSMTVEQFILDLDDLVEAVCERLSVRQVAILGHSWGSVLGVLYASRFPDKVTAYVGTSQIGDWPAAESATYAFAVAEARRLRNRRALRKLREIGPPPYSAEAVFTQRAVSLRLTGGMRPQALRRMLRPIVSSEESSLLELRGAWKGFHFTMNAMWPEVSRLNLMELAPTLQMPTFFLLGRNDPWVRPETSTAYFDALSAPAKRLVWFEHSGHEPFVDEPDKFNATMANLVRPQLPPDQTAPRGGSAP
jgi:pimeloyl-ACP methyl ester carboxylesterase